MEEYTVIHFDYGSYLSNKVEVKKIISDHELIWKDTKVKIGLPYESILGIYKFFKIDDKLINDKRLVERTGSIGIWSNPESAIKIVIFDKKNKEEQLPVLLIYKGTETCKFYREFMASCIRFGCTLSKVVENNNICEEIFRKQLNFELINSLNNDEENKRIIERNFTIHNEIRGNYSNDFIGKWKSCIQKYGNDK